MNVTEQLAKAWAAVEGAGLPEHLHEVGFKAALTLQSPQYTPVAHSPASTVAPALASLSTEVPGAGQVEPDNKNPDPIALLAHETGIEQEALEEVLYFQEGLPGLNGPGRRLGPTKADQTRTIALILTAAHHFVLGDTRDTVGAVRKECERLRCFDKDNFSRHLSSTKGLNYTGPRSNKALKAKSDIIAELKIVLTAIRKTEA